MAIRIAAAAGWAAVGLALVARYGISPEAVQLIAFCGVLAVLSVVDVERRLIPNGCIALSVCIRILYMAFAWMDSAAYGRALFADSVLGMLVLAGGLFLVVLLADRLFGRESMGGGDLKLYAVVGFYFGWYRGLGIVLLSCVLAAAYGLLASGRRSTGSAFGETVPLGPFISLACIAALFGIL